MEIVIENPVESPPPPPPPPPPLPPTPPLPSPSGYGSPTPLTTTKPPCGQLPASSSSNSMMPAATTVMTITIAENPAALSHPPVRFSYRESYSSSALSCASSLPGDSYARRASQRRPYDDPEGAPSVRRIDKSGLLGITEPEPSGIRAGLRSQRFLSGVGSSGLVSPRRLECVGQLDPVPEVPGQTSRANVAPGAAQAYHPCMPMLDRSRDPCEALSVATLSRPPKSSSFDSLEPRRSDRLEVESLHHAFERSLEGVESSASYGSFRFQEGCEARARTLGRLSRLSMKRNERESKIVEGLAKYSETCCSFPFKPRPATTALSSVEGVSGLATSGATTATVSSSTTTSVSTMREAEGTTGKAAELNVRSSGSPVPGEERAEAEGCEHGPTRNPMKDESSQRGDELLDNDAIQTLRVIILSEQL